MPENRRVMKHLIDEKKYLPELWGKGVVVEGETIRKQGEKAQKKSKLSFKKIWLEKDLLVRDIVMFQSLTGKNRQGLPCNAFGIQCVYGARIHSKGTLIASWFVVDG